MKLLKPLLASIVVLLATPSHAEVSRFTAKRKIQSYYADINSKDYKEAFNKWEIRDGRNSEGQNFGQFKKGFRDTDSVKLTITRIDPIKAAMSTLYTDVYVQVLSNNRKEGVFVYSGKYRLKAKTYALSPKEGDWEIESGDLKKQ